jgi:RimJ/RimL family protein N-acetyltransferase
MARSSESFRAIELETDRFRLIPIRPLALVLPTLHWTREPDVFANLGWRTSGWTPRRWWRHLRHQGRGDRMCHGIWPKSGGPCIGLHLLNASAQMRTALIGVVIGEKDWWGKGVVSEVREAIVDDCFERLNMERMWAQVHVRNLPSVYNHRKLGFVHEGTLRSAVVGRDGARMDMIIFGMLRAEWAARKERPRDDGV